MSDAVSFKKFFAEKFFEHRKTLSFDGAFYSVLKLVFTIISNKFAILSLSSERYR